jgi:hypothetical protein
MRFSGGFQKHPEIAPPPWKGWGTHQEDDSAFVLSGAGSKKGVTRLGGRVTAELPIRLQVNLTAVSPEPPA